MQSEQFLNSVLETLKQQPVRLICPVQNYAWGKYGTNSLITKIAHGDFNYTDTTPFAELWVGAHPKSPAQVQGPLGEISLNKLIEEYPNEMLGKVVVKNFGARLPFLFKVLSVRTALSIQAHPDSTLASTLHSIHPKHFPDEHHKPEMAYAVSDLEYLYGFLSLTEIRDNIENVPELKRLLSDVVIHKIISFEKFTGQQIEITKQLYTELLRVDKHKLQAESRLLYNRLHNKQSLTKEEQWVLRLESEYQDGDVGIFSFYILNFCKLSQGEAIFIPANVVHAYLSGDLIECMANSDNVVRAGFTSKYKDVDTLLDMLDFTSNTPKTLSCTSLGADSAFLRFLTPASEFQVDLFSSPNQSVYCGGNDKAEILFSLDGEGELFNEENKINITQGTALFISAVTPSYSLQVKQGRIFRVSIPDLSTS
jgi:mannose-6-phosphate isomerase